MNKIIFLAIFSHQFFFSVTEKLLSVQAVKIKIKQ